MNHKKFFKKMASKKIRRTKISKCGCFYKKLLDRWFYD